MERNVLSMYLPSWDFLTTTPPPFRALMRTESLILAVRGRNSLPAFWSTTTVSTVTKIMPSVTLKLRGPRILKGVPSVDSLDSTMLLATASVAYALLIVVLETLSPIVDQLLTRGHRRQSKVHRCSGHEVQDRHIHGGIQQKYKM